MLTDTHCHINDSAFDEDRQQVLQRAFESGVEHIFMPDIDGQTRESMFALAALYPGKLHAMAGLHPTSVNENPHYREHLQEVEKIVDERRDSVCGIGETGIDLYWSKDYLPQQTEAFEFQCELALKYDLPVIIHTRDAWPEIISSLDKFRGCGIRGIMHAFSGTPAHYDLISSIGHFKFGIGGVVTFKNSTLATCLASMRLEDLVLETDSPYLTPAPFRGKRNEPSYVKYISTRVAEIYGKPIDLVQRITTNSAMEVFGF